MEARDPSSVSVIIATRNRRFSLSKLLHCLRQSLQEEQRRVEVVVVNNASTDETEAYLKALADEWPILRPMNEPRPGKNFALNKGLKEARGEILCLMDDDIVLKPDWFEMLVQDYRISRYDALQPRVLPGKDAEGAEADPRRLYWYNIPVINYGEQMIDMRGLTGAIMSFRREVYEKVGGFDERLAASGYEGDTDISRRIREAGFSIGYTPHVVAYHELDPKRYGVEYARLSQYRKGLSRSIYGSDRIFLNVLPNMIAGLLRYVLYRILGRSEKVYKTEKRIMKYWGYLVGVFQRKMGREPWV